MKIATAFVAFALAGGEARGLPRGSELREDIIESEGSPLTSSVLLCKHQLYVLHNGQVLRVLVNRYDRVIDLVYSVDSFSPTPDRLMWFAQVLVSQ